jgi:proteic killer suppression protein
MLVFVIQSFRCSETESLFAELKTRKFQGIAKVAVRKLQQLHAAKSLNDLKGVGNSLEALKGNRSGQYAIRINDQYRICFEWKDGDAFQVEIANYH